MKHEKEVNPWPNIHLNSKSRIAMNIKIVEKKNTLAVHGIFDSIERAENHLNNVIPEYIRKGYFMDKTLKAEDFTIKTEEVTK